MRKSANFAARPCAAIVFGALVSTASATHPTCEPQEFHLRLRFEETIVFTGVSPCFAAATLTGRGSATHLGVVSASSQDCINPNGAFDPGAPASNSFAFVSQPAPMRIIASNGDQLFMTYSGQLTARVDRPHRIRGHFVITGGTGRYAQATGGGILTGRQDISQVVSGRGEVVAEGAISY